MARLLGLRVRGGGLIGQASARLVLLQRGARRRSRFATVACGGRIFCIGGGEIYRMAVVMPECHRIYITRVQQTFDCDTFFPETTGYRLFDVQPERTESGLTYDIATLERI